MLTEADVVHVVGGRVADDVCQGSARVETITIIPVQTVPSLPFKSNQLS